MVVNFADKIVWVLPVPIMTELKLEPEQFGLLGSSFFFLFSIAAACRLHRQPIATRWCYCAGVIWRWRSFPMVGTVGSPRS